MTITAKFQTICRVCRQPILPGQTIDWERGMGSKHVTPGDCVPVKTPVVVNPVPTKTLDVAAIVTFLTAARERGLKFPKVAFLAPDGTSEMRLSLAGSTSKNPGGVYVKINGEYLGVIRADGTLGGSFEAGNRSLPKDDRLQETIAAVAVDPVAAAKAYGALKGLCSFCSTPLTDAGSVEVGYGPICAKRYGLPHKPKGTPDLKVVPVVENTGLWEAEL